MDDSELNAQALHDERQAVLRTAQRQGALVERIVAALRYIVCPVCGQDARVENGIVRGHRYSPHPGKGHTEPCPSSRGSVVDVLAPRAGDELIAQAVQLLPGVPLDVLAKALDFMWRVCGGGAKRGIVLCLRVASALAHRAVEHEERELTVADWEALCHAAYEQPVPMWEAPKGSGP